MNIFNQVIVYLKHIQFVIEHLTCFLPVSFMSDWQICLTLSLLACFLIQMHGHLLYMQFK